VQKSKNEKISNFDKTKLSSRLYSWSRNKFRMMIFRLCPMLINVTVVNANLRSLLWWFCFRHDKSLHICWFFDTMYDGFLDYARNDREFRITDSMDYADYTDLRMSPSVVQTVTSRVAY